VVVSVVFSHALPGWALVVGLAQSSVSSGSVTDSTIEKFNPENMGIAVGIFFLV